jgi:phage terminase small subunit
MPLTPNQQRFVEEYLVDLNATQAAIRAGYSAKTANRQGARLLTKADIQAAIQAAQQARSGETKITAARVLQELALIAFQDPADVFDFKGEKPTMRPAHEIPEAARRAMSSIRFKDGEVAEVKFWSKDSALEKIGKHLGMFLEKIELTEKVKVVLTEEIVDADSATHDPAP